MLRLLHAITVSAAMAFCLPMHAEGGGCESNAKLNVSCSRASAFVQVQVANCKKLGKLVLEVRDQQGRVLYREEGKAFTGDLVRRLDKGQLPRGTHVLSIVAKEVSLSQPFTIE
ncbi:MAG: hypothetical protein IPJ85_13530 [Flavobacteriales bacterium]|nr:hypothetical protein [Flavobacteriales bacterium]